MTTESKTTLRLATFNIAMGRPQAGAMTTALQHQSDAKLQQVAAILQTIRPDIILLNEFDFDVAVDAAALFNGNYLGISQHGLEAVDYPYHFRAPVNTGIDSGLDLDRNGSVSEAADCWGFGQFPGQYGMLILSRFPIDVDNSRTFQHFRWADLPRALRPLNPDGSDYYPQAVWQQLRLSSKSHWDVLLHIRGRALHLLAFHPTPPVFDGPENRNGRRNHDEIRFWAEYLQPGSAGYIRDDQGRSGGLAEDAAFVIAGDFNADPHDGDSHPGAMAQVLDHPRVNNPCTPRSQGAVHASQTQAGVNARQRGDPAADTADFDDQRSGNLRLDYLLPAHSLQVADCGVFWPAPGQAGQDWADVSDHRLVWLDITW